MSFQFGAFQDNAFQIGSGGGQNLLPPLVTNDNAFYAASITRGPVNLAFARLDNVNDFFAARLDLHLSQATRYDNANVFYGPQIDLNLSQSARFDNTNAFYSPSISLRVYPPLVVNDNEFYSPTVTQPGGTQTLTFEDYVASGYMVDGYVTFPASFTRNEFFPFQLAYDQTLSLALFTNANSFFGGLVYMPYPDPSYVKAGIVYGPGGIYVGTYVGEGRKTLIVFDD